jgi:putative transposase
LAGPLQSPATTYLARRPDPDDGPRQKRPREPPLGQQAGGIVASDCFTADSIWRQRLYVLFLSNCTPHVHLAGVTTDPNGGWVTQQARNLLLVLAQQGRQLRLLVRDHDAKVSHSFDDVFCSDGAQVLMTPVQAPTANPYAERWVRTVRAECLDWLLVVGRGHLEQILRTYVRHDNGHRPHRALGLQPPDQPGGLTVVAEDQQGRLRRHDLLGLVLAPRDWSGW